MKVKKQIPNLFTVLRIVLSVALLFLKPFSPAFFAVYLAAGLTDAADGFLARRMEAESALGAKLDSVADLVMIGVCALRILPKTELPLWLWCWVGAIALLRGTDLLLGLARYRRLVMLHTLPDKVTGVLLFLWPLAFIHNFTQWGAVTVCAVASVAALHEGCCILKLKKTEQSDTE